MNPTAPAAHRPYFHWTMQYPNWGWTGSMPPQGAASVGSAAAAAQGAASGAAEAAAHAAATGAPHVHAPQFRLPHEVHHNIQFSERIHPRHFRPRYGPRLFPLLLVGGGGVWAYHKVKRQLWDVRDELDRLERKIDIANGPAPVNAPEAVASTASAEQVKAQRREHRGGWGHHLPSEARQWEKSWGWGSGPVDSRV